MKVNSVKCITIKISALFIALIILFQANAIIYSSTHATQNQAGYLSFEDFIKSLDSNSPYFYFENGLISQFGTYWQTDYNGYTEEGGMALTASSLDLITPEDDTVFTDTNLPFFDWYPYGRPISYELFIYDSNLDIIFSTTTSRLTTEYQLTTNDFPEGLSDGTYRWDVKANIFGDPVWSSRWSFVISTTALDPPVLISPVNGYFTSDTTPFLDWSSVDSAVQYNLKVRDSDTAVLDVTTSNTWYTLPSLPDEEYFWQVRTKNTVDNWGEWSEEWMFTVDTIAPEVPILEYPIDITVTDDTPTLTWQDVPDAEHYNIYIHGWLDLDHIEIEDIISADNEYYTVPQHLPCDRDFYWKVRAQDFAGNWGEWSTFARFDVDDEPPESPNLTYPYNGYITNNIYLSLSWSSPETAVEYHLLVDDNSDFTSPIVDEILTETSYVHTSGYSDDTYYWKVSAIDDVGNEGFFSSVRNFVIDTVAPARPSLDSPATGSVISYQTDPTPHDVDLSWLDTTSTDEWQIQVSDNPDFNSLEFDTILPDVSGVAVHQFTVLNLDDGIYYWRVRGIDIAGNEGEWSYAWSFSIDTTGPDAPILNDPSHEAMINDNKPDLSWNYDSDVILYEIVILQFSPLGGSETYYTSDFTFSVPDALINGYVYSWKVRGKDQYDNWGDYSVPRQFTVDTEPPETPELGLPANGDQINNPNPTLYWNEVPDAVEYRIILENLAIGFAADYYTSNLYYQLPILEEGTYHWSVYARDEAGNWGESNTKYFTIDLTEPEAPTLHPLANGDITNDITPDFSWTPHVDDDDISYFEIQVSDTSAFNDYVLYETTTDTFYTSSTIEFTTEGTYYWRVRAIDEAGNIGVWQETANIRVFEIDLTAPIAPLLISPINDISVGENGYPTFEWNGLDEDILKFDLHVKCTNLDVLPPFDTIYPDILEESFQIPDKLIDNPYSWRVRCYDIAGNIGEWSLFSHFIVDTVPPEEPILNSPINNAHFNVFEVTLEWTGSDDSVSYEVHIDDNEYFYSYNTFETTQESIQVTLPADDTYYWRVIACDEAGNWIELYQSYPSKCFVIDTQAPITPILSSPSSGTRINQNPTLRWAEVSDAEWYDIEISTSSTNFVDPEFLVESVRLHKDHPSALAYSPSIILSEGIYFWRVRAIDKAGNIGDWSDPDPNPIHYFIIDKTPPLQPYNPYPNDEYINTNSPTLSWSHEDVDGDLDDFYVYVAYDDRIMNTVPGCNGERTDGETFLKVDLTGEGRYYWRVHAIDKANNLIISPVWTFEVDLTPPDAPQLLLPNSFFVTEENPTYTWQDVSDAEYYKIYISDDPNFSNYWDYQTTETSFTIPDILPCAQSGTYYYWRVYAVDPAGNPSASSETRTYVLDYKHPFTPEAVFPVVNQVFVTEPSHFSWTPDTLGDTISYTLQVTLASDSDYSTPCVNVETTKIYYTDPFDLVGDGDYIWRVIAEDEAGNTSESNQYSFTIDTTPPETPILQSPINGASTTPNLITFEWYEVVSEPIQLYKIEIATDGLFADIIDTMIIDNTQGTITSYEYYHTLASGTYYWRVRAMDYNSNWSDETATGWSFIV